MIVLCTVIAVGTTVCLYSTINCSMCVYISAINNIVFHLKLVDWKAWDCIKMVVQGLYPIAEYTKEFRDLVCCLNSPEDILESCFKDGLNDDLYHACIVQRALAHLHDCCILAEEVEIDHARNQHWSSRSRKENGGDKTSDSPAALNCLLQMCQGGQWAVECHERTPTKKAGRPPGGKATKPFQHLKDTTLKTVKVIEFHPTTKKRLTT